MRTLIATLLSMTIATVALAQKETAPPRELPVSILSATVQTFDPPMPSRNGRYEQALVLRLEAERGLWESLPPSVETFLYIGTHELLPIATDLDRDRVVLTFHDPDWKSLQGGETMVLTVDHGDPIFDSGKYAGYPKFDPKIISEK
ncbi:MAG: hypothetical protein ABI779_01780 [Acidobacteriota bacterium]